MIDCSQFLDGYSAFRDGELDDEVRAQYEAHRSACSSCERYDRVISEGVQLYRRCPDIAVSDDFLPRLQHRLYHLEDDIKGPGRSGSGVRTALPLALAASIAAVAWIPALRSEPQLLQLPPIAARAPLPPAPPATDGSSIFAPAVPGMGIWQPTQPMRPATDPFSDYRFGNSEARLQPVSQW